MISLLFESPWTLSFLAAAVCLILLVLWRRTGSPGRRKAFLIAVVASVALLVLQAIVVTDRERIMSQLDALAEAVERVDLPQIDRAIDADYTDGRDDRGRLLATIHERLTRYTIRGARLSAFDITVDGGDATVRFRCVCDLAGGEAPGGTTVSRWEVRLVRRDEGWRVRSIRLLQLNSIDMTGLGPGW